MGYADKTPSKTFKDLLVWQKSHQFVLDIYRLTRTFPKEETYGLVSQLRRATVSMPANIAEGFRKRGKADKVRFFNIAQGSLEEVRYYLILTRDLKYGDTKQLMILLEEISKMLESYIRSVLDSGC